MICPNCKKESNGAKWCPNCGLQLEAEETTDKVIYKSSLDDTQKIRPLAPVEKKPDTVQKPKSKKDSDKIFRISLISIIAVGIVAIIIVVCVLLGKLDDAKVTNEEKKTETVLNTSDSEELFETGLKELEDKDYEEAETIFKTVLETSDDSDKAKVLYDIVYNYNRASKKLQAKKYTDARKLFKLIPLDYMDYPISEDIDKLDEEIASFELAYETFEAVQDCMADADYEGALASIALIDKAYLASPDVTTLDEYSAQIKQYMEAKDESEEGDFSLKKAEIIITEYCEDMVMAINARDFSIVEKHISGQLYNDQKKLVQTSIDNAITQSLDYVKVSQVHKISDTKWKVDVSEGETTYFSDGTKDEKTYERTYTIEYIDSEYFLTKIE